MDSSLSLTIAACVLLCLASSAPGACGDGAIDAGEDCDDGNVEAGDCCSPACLFEASSTVCRVPAGPCDVAEACSGTSAVCPPDLVRNAGASCTDDGIACTEDVCDGMGQCVHAPDDARCQDGGACSTARCDASGCVTTPLPDGAPCQDGDECTTDDRCTAGACTPGPERCATVAAAGARVTVECAAAGRGRGTCSAQAFVEAPHPAAGTVVTRMQRRPIGKRGRVRFEIPLNRTGRKLLATASPLPIGIDVVVLRDGEGTIVRRSLTLEAGRTSAP